MQPVQQPSRVCVVGGAGFLGSILVELLLDQGHEVTILDAFLYGDEGSQVGFSTSFLDAPVLQRHVGIGRVPVAASQPGCKVNLEVPINHRYVHVAAHTARLPHYNPQRKTA